MVDVQDTSTPKRKILKQNSYLSVVPWSNAEQFIKVYEKLYSPKVNDKRWAVDEISIWETRCYPSLPTAIETTVVVVGAIIQDMLLDATNTLCDNRDLQTLYSMAIVRFINLVLQTEGKNLTILADQHNIPRWVLDLRHDATHANLPNLALLRMGAKFAFKYLEDIYWKEEAANVCQIVTAPPRIEDKVFDVILKFKNVQFALTEASDNSELERDRLKLLEKITSLVKSYKQKFVEALVKPGVFLSAEDILRLLTFTGETIFLEHKDLLTLPESLQKFWFSVIRILHSADLISYFLEMLLLSLEHCTNAICQKTAASWAIYVLNETSPNAPSSNLSNRFKAKGGQLHLRRLLYASVKAPNRFSRHTFKVIINKLPNKKKYAPVLVPFSLRLMHELPANILPDLPPSLKTVKTKRQQKDEPFFFTAEDFENDYNEENFRRQGPNIKKNIWSLAPVYMDFSDLPLGAILNPTFPVQNEAETMCEDDDDMDVSFEQKFIIEENDKEPTVEVKRTPDINHIFQDPDIGNMMYNR